MSITPLRPGDVVRIRDERWTVARYMPHGRASMVDVHGCDRANRDVRASFVLPFEPLERLPVSRAARIVRPRRWRHLARTVLSAARPSCDALSTAARANIEILPFQLEPVLAVMRGLASRILIADEVGLGKTIQAGLVIAEALERCEQPHVLVIVPAALREQWAGELRDRFGLRAAIIDSASLARTGPGTLPGANPWAVQPVIVTSIDYVKRPEALRALETLVWDLVVFDEAHTLATRSERHTAAAALAGRARRLVMLTATPHSGIDDEFARLCGIGDLDAQFPLLVFRRTRADVGLSSSRHTARLRVRPTVAEQRMHQALLTYARLVWHQRGPSSTEARLAMMVLTKRASSGATALARSLDRRLALLSNEPAAARQILLPLDVFHPDDDEPGAELGAPGLHDVGDERTRLHELLDLARAAQVGESKVRALRRLLRRAGEPAIVFTEYRDTLAHLQAELGEFTTTTLHGGLGQSERHDVLRDFTSGTADVLLATDAASEGLNLHQRCRLVINLELPWTPRRLEQRAGRVQRIGQLKRVHEVHLVAADTFEETTLEALTRRTEHAGHVVEALRGPMVREQDVADVVLGNGLPPASAESAAGSLPPGVVVTNLREAAMREAARITLSRALGTGDAVAPNRPFVTALRRHGHPRHAYWAFRLEFTDAESYLVLETLLALQATVVIAPPRDGSGIRSWMERCGHALAPAVMREHRKAADALTEWLSTPLALAIRRERAIVAHAEQRRARIAALLVQGALFDRRGEREASDQAAVLDELLCRCRLQLERLERRRRIAAGPSEPAFALITGA